MSHATDPAVPTAEPVDVVDAARRRILAAWRADESPTFPERLAAFDALAERLLRDAQLAGVPGLAFLTAFLRRSSLEHMIDREVRDTGAFERFVPIGARKSLRLVPRGLVCHWVAGNVPLLGLFSWAVSALVGNANLIRLSSRQDDLLSAIVDRLAATGSTGRRMAEETAIVQFDRDDRAAHELMSRVADVRLAWGGEQAVAAIQELPARWDAETIVMGPRASLAVVDPAETTDRAVGRLVTDIVYFDQLACSSPQRLFVKAEAGTATFEDFVQRFATAFARQARAIPRHRLDWAETYRIELDRARVLLSGGTLRHDADTEWTVALVERPLDALLCANRFLQVVPFADLEDVVATIPTNVQTVVTLLRDEDLERFSERAAAKGVCRFPRPGEGNNFETPWDGTPLVTRLTRWVVRTDGASTDSRRQAAGAGEKER